MKVEKYPPKRITEGGGKERGRVSEGTHHRVVGAFERSIGIETRKTEVLVESRVWRTSMCGG
jgi:hypothetical protein